jgi:glycosidase
MLTSVFRDTQAALDLARAGGSVAVPVGSRSVELPTPFPSPADWRDLPIYFLMVDRFNNPTAPPRQAWDTESDTFQGGTLEGVRAALPYLQELGVGAVWISPVLKNPQYDRGAYHGYGIQDFLAVEPRFTSDPARARSDPAFAEAELRQLVDEAHARGLYVIFDIVLNHTGDVFAYDSGDGVADWRDRPYEVHWRGPDGHGRRDWTEPPADPPPDAAVWPTELRRNPFFRRQGNAFTRPQELLEAGGDFFSLKELVTGYDEGGSLPVRDILIRAYQYLIARYDVDGYRIDTLKFVEADFARSFGNAMREYALSIGKKNFFTFGEVYDGEDKIAGFVGRHAGQGGDLVGVDAALDFPLFFRLPAVVKGQAAPADLVAMFEYRKQVEADVVSSHGDASRFFVTFLDNHDQDHRFYFSDPAEPHRFDAQATLGLAALFCLQGIPCVYYGTEQGLHGAGDRPEAVREALWGKPDAFDPSHPFARTCQRLGDLRRAQPALRYGRQYFRPVSGDGRRFGVSPFPGGVLAFSRILNDIEVVVVANMSTAAEWSGRVVVDASLHPAGTELVVLFTNHDGAPVTAPQPVSRLEAGTVSIREVTGASTNGPVHALGVTLRPMEIQVLGRRPL